MTPDLTVELKSAKHARSHFSSAVVGAVAGASLLAAVVGPVIKSHIDFLNINSEIQSEQNQRSRIHKNNAILMGSEMLMNSFANGDNCTGTLAERQVQQDLKRDPTQDEDTLRAYHRGNPLYMSSAAACFKEVVDSLDYADTADANTKALDASIDQKYNRAKTIETSWTYRAGRKAKNTLSRLGF